MHISTSVPSPNHYPHQLQYVALICDKNSAFFHTSVWFSLCLPHPHCVNFVCVVSTALFISVPCLLHSCDTPPAFPHIFDCIFCTSLHFTLCIFCVFIALCPGTSEHLGCVWDILYALTHILLSLCFVFPTSHSGLHWSHFMLAHYTDISLIHILPDLAIGWSNFNEIADSPGPLLLPLDMLSVVHKHCHLSVTTANSRS